MRITVTLDDELLAKAAGLTGLKEKPALVREALKALIQRESTRRLALLGGSERALKAVPRRRAGKMTLNPLAVVATHPRRIP